METRREIADKVSRKYFGSNLYDDVRQAAFEGIIEAEMKYKKGKGSFDSWRYWFAKNRAIDCLRIMYNPQEVGGECLERFGCDFGFSWVEIFDLIEKTCSAIERDAIIKKIKGYSLKEIAPTKKEARSILSKAKRRILKEWKNDLGKTKISKLA